MQDYFNLNKLFGIQKELEFRTIQGNLVSANIKNKFAEATICLYGAHIMSYKPLGEKDLLWMSPKSYYEEGKPIRGGIPICFPWFGPHKTDSKMPLHGCVRLFNWNVIKTRSLSNGETMISLEIVSSEDTKKYWPFDFKAQLDVICGRKLEVNLTIINTDYRSFDYTCGIHSYFNISEISNIKIEGLMGSTYFTTFSEEYKLQDSQYIEVKQEENRRHIDTEADCIIHDAGFKRKILASKRGSKSTVVWNPWTESIKNMHDLPEDGYKSFICIESVNAFNDIISINPGKHHTTSAIIYLSE